jgi:ribosomal protein S18 acetylase RimI-like enzyme
MIEIRPFGESDLPAAGRLLAARHRRHRVAQLLLSARFEDPLVAQAEVDAAWRAEDASGAVAVRDGEPVGYLLGSPKSADLWGPNVWVESAGLAVTEPEAMRDLYAAAAAGWVAAGRTAHYMLVPAHDEELLQAWYRLAFGQQHAHAIRPVLEAPPAVPPHLRIRPPTRADIATLAALEVELPRHQSLAPTFSSGRLTVLEESIAEWEDDFDDPEFTTFVAEYDGRVVGSAVGCALEKSSLHRGPAMPDHAAFLGFAAVLPEARGLGAGRALGETVLAWAGEQGFGSVVTDWRVTNLLSSRAWPALGFEETFLRVHRLVGH